MRSSPIPFPTAAVLPAELSKLILDAAGLMAKQSIKAFRTSRRGRRSGVTLKPGRADAAVERAARAAFLACI